MWFFTSGVCAIEEACAWADSLNNENKLYEVCQVHEGIMYMSR